MSRSPLQQCLLTLSLPRLVSSRPDF